MNTNIQNNPPAELTNPTTQSSCARPRSHNMVHTPANTKKHPKRSIVCCAFASPPERDLTGARLVHPSHAHADLYHLAVEPEHHLLRAELVGLPHSHQRHALVVWGGLGSGKQARCSRGDRPKFARYGTWRLSLKRPCLMLPKQLLATPADLLYATPERRASRPEIKSAVHARAQGRAAQFNRRRALQTCKRRGR